MRVRSQSALLTIWAQLGFEASKSRKRSICRLMWATLLSMSSTVSTFRRSDLPDGSPIMPVPPPISANGLWPAFCKCAIAMIGM